MGRDTRGETEWALMGAIDSPRENVLFDEVGVAVTPPGCADVHRADRESSVNADNPHLGVGGGLLECGDGVFAAVGVEEVDGLHAELRPLEEFRVDDLLEGCD